MRKTRLVFTALAAAAAVLVLAAPAGAATTCTAKAIWHHDWDGDALVTPDPATATGDGCADLLPEAGTRYHTRTVFSMSAPTLAGLWRVQRPGPEGGTIKVTGYDLDAVILGSGYMAVYDGDGSSCGPECYRTTGRWYGELRP